MADAEQQHSQRLAPFGSAHTRPYNGFRLWSRCMHAHARARLRCPKPPTPARAPVLPPAPHGELAAALGLRLAPLTAVLHATPPTGFFLFGGVTVFDFALVVV